MSVKTDINPFPREVKFKAWHNKLHKMMDVHSFVFHDSSADAEVSEQNSKIFFRAKMNDITLLQNTNKLSYSGERVFEGDIVIVLVGNEFDSAEEAVGEVIYDDSSWGYNVRLYEHSGLRPTGMDIVAVIGNVFEGITELSNPMKKHETKNHQ